MPRSNPLAFSQRIGASLRRWFGREEAEIEVDDGDYARRIAQEQTIFAQQEEVNDLPAIFHYWSDKYLRPKLEEFGFSNPDQFFAHFIEQAYRDAQGKPVRVASLGCGNCDTEVRVSRLLKERGCDFVIECIDINRTMLDRGLAHAAAEGVSDHIRAVIGDFNDWRPAERYDVIMANQSLHHVVALEKLFQAIERALMPQGRFVTSDMIGRNGHMRWPEALAVVREFWSELPARCRYNVQLRRQEDEFLDWDCSVEGFEGIRAQDILPLLVARFDFEFFLGFGNIIDPFIDRAFGPHFDAQSESDRQFIDRVHARDEAEMAAGRVKPTHMMAVLRHRPFKGPARFHGGRVPQQSVREVLSSQSG
ncbi:MAG TPA: class I SAM-dependent methyltransferase [Rudaea sp.]